MTGADTAALPLLPTAGQLAQIDLSDDIVVAQLFGNGVWQELLEPLDAQVRGGWREQGARPAIDVAAACHVQLEGNRAQRCQRAADDRCRHTVRCM